MRSLVVSPGGGDVEMQQRFGVGAQQVINRTGNHVHAPLYMHQPMTRCHSCKINRRVSVRIACYSGARFLRGEGEETLRAPNPGVLHLYVSVSGLFHSYW